MDDEEELKVPGIEPIATAFVISSRIRLDLDELESKHQRQMILNFRVSELHLLLTFAGRNKFGRKSDLQNRAFDLLKLRSLPVYEKIRKLHEALQLSILNNPGDSALKALEQVVDQPKSATMQPNRGYAGYPAPQQQVNRAIYNSMYQHQQQYQLQPKPAVVPHQFPVHPDVKLKSLPFYDFLAELVKPSTLVPQGTNRHQEMTFMFHLTPAQAEAITTARELKGCNRAEHDTQVLVRFCLLETTSQQEDCFPPGIQVKVNQKVCTLPNPIPPNKPGVEPKRPPRPVNVTQFVKLSPVVANHIAIQWLTDYTRGYVMAVHLVEKRTSDELLSKLKNKGARAADYTRGMIKDKLKEDGEIATTSLRVSLACPLGKMRMSTPCRASTCDHFQCFDASLFLQMNEKKPQWMCPVCNKPAIYDTLVIDGYFQEVLESSKLPSDCSEIQLNMDGAWSILLPNSKDQSCVVEPPVAPVKLEPVKVEPVKIEPVPKKIDSDAEKDVQIITLSDSDDEPLMPRKPTTLEHPPPEPVTTSQECPAKQARQSPSVIILDEDSPVPSPPQLAPPPYNTRGYPNYLNMSSNEYPYK